MGDSLRGLALGDGFGERWFHYGGQQAAAMIRDRRTPTEAPFYYTDDTSLALSIAWALHTEGRIDQQDLARLFAEEFLADPMRGYGNGMIELLPKLGRDPGNWATYARSLFGGLGSWGNGAAMRVAPLGAYFHRDLGWVVEEATRSAEVTHANPEGVAGAVAVAVAAAIFALTRSGGGDEGEGGGGSSGSSGSRGGMPVPSAVEFLSRVGELTPAGIVREGLFAAAEVPASTPPWKASDVLGNGQRVRASDTVPFAAWAAAHHPDCLEDALWATAAGLGDVDTTCAITGGIVGARTGIGSVPKTWLTLREQLPDWAEQL